jgi:hypothetical protein
MYDIIAKKQQICYYLDTIVSEYEKISKNQGIDEYNNNKQVFIQSSVPQYETTLTKYVGDFISSISSENNFTQILNKITEKKKIEEEWKKTEEERKKTKEERKKKCIEKINEIYQIYAKYSENTEQQISKYTYSTHTDTQSSTLKVEYILKYNNGILYLDEIIEKNDKPKKIIHTLFPNDSKLLNFLNTNYDEFIKAAIDKAYDNAQQFETRQQHSIINDNEKKRYKDFLKNILEYCNKFFFITKNSLQLANDNEEYKIVTVFNPNEPDFLILTDNDNNQQEYKISVDNIVINLPKNVLKTIENVHNQISDNRYQLIVYSIIAKCKKYYKKHTILMSESTTKSELILLYNPDVNPDSLYLQKSESNSIDITNLQNYLNTVPNQEYRKIVRELIEKCQKKIDSSWHVFAKFRNAFQKQTPGGKTIKNTKYVLTDKKVNIIYANKKIRRNIYLKGKAKIQYCKVDKKYVLLSKLKLAHNK